jgi:hypothetical protein
MSKYMVGAALKGIGDAGGILAQGMMSAYDRQQRTAEEDRRRKELEEQRHQDRIELLQMRQQGGSGGGKSGGGFLAAEAGGSPDELMASQMGMSLPEYQRFVEAEKTGDYSAYNQTTPVEDESGGHTRTGLPESFEAFKAEKRARRGKLMETYAFSGDINKIADSRATDQMVDLTGKAATGDRGAQEGVLVNKGKDPKETAAKGQKAEAEADLKDRTDPNRPRSGGRGSSLPQDALNLRALVASLNQDVRSQRTIVSTSYGSKRAAEEEKLAALEAELSRARSGLQKAESGAPASAAQSGTSKRGSSWVQVK